MNRKINTNQYAVDDNTEFGPDVDLDVESYSDANGERISEAAAQEYTAERAEAARRGGRPPLGKKGSSPSVAFRISAELRERAEEVAAKEGRTLSAIAREQLERYINSHAA
ncbi:hypothetical protein [Gulosibacter molinativorax]|uniref:Ribbon-helix-helix protein, CopG family n=1 Tax=Gulosibacter molinativorax TaxID=256821 RepID=A0ABT7C821_9MICO|nr:hypothetical protein [Gulosibacter molinativorax]MDJ1370904.1 hypothetical protein [Gulosibacter molinativorax]QUY62241.1 Hypotetical protein [Gulosibacter molinativorax]